jgi:hypothetical protein
VKIDSNMKDLFIISDIVLDNRMKISEPEKYKKYEILAFPILWEKCKLVSRG